MIHHREHGENRSAKLRLLFLRQFLKHQIVGIAQEGLQFFFAQRVETFERDPVIARHVWRGHDAISFDQLRKLFRRALE